MIGAAAQPWNWGLQPLWTEFPASAQAKSYCFSLNTKHLLWIAPAARVALCFFFFSFFFSFLFGSARGARGAHAPPQIQVCRDGRLVIPAKTQALTECSWNGQGRLSPRL